MASSNLAIRILAKNSSQAAFKEVSGGLAGIASAVLSPTKALGGLMDGLGKLGLAGMGVKALADTVGGLATSMVAGNAEFERYQTQFGVLLGGAEKAKDRLKELADFGAKTPFELPEVVRADKILQSFGLHAEESAKRFGVSGQQIRTIAGDVAAGTGAGFEEISTYIGKLASGSTGLAISRFEELGIVTRQQLTQMGLEFSKSGELVSPLDKSMGVILSAMKQKFGGMMDAQSSTFEGMMSNLTDWIGQTKNALMAPIFEVLKEKLGAVLTFLGSDAVKGAIAGFAAFLSQGISQAITTIGNLWTAAQPTIAFLIDGFTRLAEFVGRFVQYLSPSNDYDLMGALFGPDVGPRIDEVVRAVKGIAAAIVDLVTGAGASAPAVFGALQQVLTDLGPTGERVGEMFKAVLAAVSKLVPEPVKSLIADFAEWAAKAITAFKPVDKLVDVVNALSGAVKAATEFLTDHKEVQALLVGVMGSIAAAYVLATAVQLAHTIATVAQTAATNVLAVAQGILNAVMSANPIGLVIIAIAGLVAGLIYAYNTSEDFRNIVDAVWSFLQTSVTAAIAAIEGSIQGWAFAVETTRDLIGWALDGIVRFFIDLPGRILDTLTSFMDAGRQLGENIVKGMRQGLRNIQIPMPDIGVDWEEITSALGSIWIPKFRVGVSWRSLGDLIPELAAGTKNFGGGLAWVGEKGPELVGLPQGARVWSASESRGMGGGGNVYITVQGSVIAERDLTQRLRAELIRIGKRNVSALGGYA